MLVELHSWMACTSLEAINAKGATTLMTFSTLILIGKHGQVSRHKEMLHVPEQTIQWCSMMELCMYLQATMGEQDTMTYGSAL